MNYPIYLKSHIFVFHIASHRFSLFFLEFISEQIENLNQIFCHWLKSNPLSSQSTSFRIALLIRKFISWLLANISQRTHPLLRWTSFAAFPFIKRLLLHYISSSSETPQSPNKLLIGFQFKFTYRNVDYIRHIHLSFHVLVYSG